MYRGLWLKIEGGDCCGGDEDRSCVGVFLLLEVEDRSCVIDGVDLKVGGLDCRGGEDPSFVGVGEGIDFLGRNLYKKNDCWFYFCVMQHMTTVTIEKDVRLDRYFFKTIEEFEDYILSKKISDKPEMVFVPDEEVPSDVFALSQQAKQTSLSDFISV